MRKGGQRSAVSGQGSKARGQKLKRILIFLLLFIVHCSLSTVVTGCGKKAPPKPPKEDSQLINPPSPEM